MELSILIPARKEMFLAKTVEDILHNIEGDTEVIVVLQEDWADPGIPIDPRVTVVYHPNPIGQRAATNEAAKLSNAKYVMKVDAHCAFDKGFDVKMMADMQDDMTMVPVMRNLHVYDWVCPDGHRRYQGPSGVCKECGKETTRDIVWIAKKSPNSTAYRFDKTLHFQYWEAFEKRPEGQGDLTESMSIQGSAFMLTRERYFALDICDEKHGSWGQQGVEVACKTWLSGGRVVINHKTWYAHMFRTQGGDFGFPYENPGKDIERARKYSRDLWLNNKWPKAIHPLSWLIDKFAPVPEWDVSKGVVYYTENTLDPVIMKAVQDRLVSVFTGKIINVSLKKLDFGENITLPLERGYLTMFKQILKGLEYIDTDIVFLCEHDVMYHPSHFDFIPPKQDVFYYNTNVWKYDAHSGRAYRVDDCRQTSGLIAYRSLLLEHYRKRVEMVERDGFSRNMGFEPGTHNRKERVDDYKSERFESAYPNVDIRHDKNLTKTRWSPDEFRDKRYTKGWQESTKIPGWDKIL